MKNISAVVYDLEIIKGVPSRNEPTVEGIEYCAGWDDHANMGISVIGAYDYYDDRYRVFCKDNFNAFTKLAAERVHRVSFNGIGFDNKVLKAANLWPMDGEGAYDILRELWLADGLSPTFNFKTHGGYGLNQTAMANFSDFKTGHGALAPIQWQRGEIGDVIDYCLNDVRLTKRLFDRILETGGLRSPKDPSHFLDMRAP